MSDDVKQPDSLEPLSYDRLRALQSQPILSTSEVAQLARVTYFTAQNAYRGGALAAIKVGKFVRHTRAQVDSYLAGLANGSP